MFNIKSAVLLLGSLSILSLPFTTFADETAGQYMEGSSITAGVKAKFLADSQIKSLDISVATEKGVVTLTGTVDNQAEITKAGEIAKSIKGVTKVRNDLKLKTPEQPLNQE